MRYCKLGSLNLIEYQLSNAAPTKDAPVNHIWIYDRSGSMHYLLPSLAEDLVSHAHKLKLGDTLSIAWFSGEGDYRFLLKGFRIVDAVKDRDTISQTIRNNALSRNTTCFSEVLGEASEVVTDLSALEGGYALMFFTDGYPVVSNPKKEHNDTITALKNLKPLVSSALFVGYGDYYNRALMSEMADTVGGALLHSEALPRFSDTMRNFVQERDLSPRQEVKIELPSQSILAVFYLQGRDVIVCPVEDSKASVPQNVREIFIISSSSAGGETPLAGREREAYAGAKVLLQKGKADLALEILGALGDVALIDAVDQAFTNAEYGQAEAAILAAVNNADCRYTRGCNTNYLPKPDAFCLLDALELLMADPEAKFYPRHPAFSYKRIGVAANRVDGYPEFKAEDNAACPVSTLVWDESRLNLSVLARIPGTVNLGEDASKHGFAEVYPTWIYRNYALIKDGILNVTMLPISMSEDSFNRLQEEGVIYRNHSWEAGLSYVFNLQNIPLINRAIAEGKTSAKHLCELTFEELKLKGRIKALNHLLNERQPEKRMEGLTPEQQSFLESKGIGRNGFNPPTEKGEPTDFYLAKEFQIKPKKYSSLPSINEVRKQAEKAKFTPSGLLVADGLAWFDAHASHLSSPIQIAWLEDEIKRFKGELFKVRSQIQRIKFSIIMGKKWFDEFGSRENCSLKVGDVDFDFVLGETKVPY